MTYLNPIRKKWQAQKDNAKRRNIPFLLTFEQWLNVWQSSGHINEMGKGNGKYCMDRHGDVGSYEIGNVKIITHNQNSTEYVRTPESNASRSAKLKGRIMTEAHKAKIGKANAGRSYSAETKLKMSISARNRKVKPNGQNVEGS